MGAGDHAAVDEAVKRFSSNLSMARELGSTAVMRKIDALEQQRAPAQATAAQPAAERGYEAKRMKSRAQLERRADAYNDNALDGM